MLSAYLFGAGGGGARLYDCVKEQYDIVGIVDNDERKWGTMFRNHEIGIPEKCLKQSTYDVIVLTSAPGRDSIIHQVLGYGIAENRIITTYIDQPLESRKTFLKSLSVLMREYGQSVSIAEAGVFQGDFAKCMNQYFPDRQLYLFDTFEGFDAKDIVLERQNNYSAAGEADYHNTSPELVRQKMKYPERCIFKTGYFPKTARDIEAEFCFVNLDLDLYQPTLEGLRWFESKMVKGGVILVHDYFADNFRGVRQAVDEYMRNRLRQELHLMPIGDGISIAVCGF